MSKQNIREAILIELRRRWVCAACELLNRPRITYAPFDVIDIITVIKTAETLSPINYYRRPNIECVAPVSFDFIRFNYNNRRVDTIVAVKADGRSRKKTRSSLREMRYGRRSLRSFSAVYRIHFSLYNFLCGQLIPFGFFIYRTQHWLRCQPYSRNSIAATRRSAFECVHIMMCHAISILIW